MSLALCESFTVAEAKYRYRREYHSFLFVLTNKKDLSLRISLIISNKTGDSARVSGFIAL